MDVSGTLSANTVNIQKLDVSSAVVNDLSATKITTSELIIGDISGTDISAVNMGIHGVLTFDNSANGIEYREELTSTNNLDQTFYINSRIGKLKLSLTPDIDASGVSDHYTVNNTFVTNDSIIIMNCTDVKKIQVHLYGVVTGEWKFFIVNSSGSQISEGSDINFNFIVIN